MSWEVRTLNPDDTAWEEVLERIPHDIYHTRAYHRFVSALEGGKPVAVHLTDGRREALVPYLVRDIPVVGQGGAEATARDAISVYGYTGVLSPNPIPPSATRGLVAALQEPLRRQAVISLFARQHPLFGGFGADGGEAGEERPAGFAVNRLGDVVIMRLGRDEEAVWSDIRARVRTDIRGLERDGYRVVIDDWSRYDDFVRVYLDNMRRVDAAAYYYFSDRYFAELRTFLPGSVGLATMVGPEGDTAAAMVFFRHGDTLTYHLGGTSGAHLDRSPMKGLFWGVARWGREAGYGVLQLGGGVGGHNDSLFRFKRQFSKDRAPFRVVKLIADRAAYDRLSGGSDAGAALEPGRFFPPYRAPTEDSDADS